MASPSGTDAKVVLLGRHDVGKTSLVERFSHGRFKENLSMTVGAAFSSKTLTVNGKPFTLGIWDTAGAERYESMTKQYYKSANFAIVCYDITDRASFEKARFWIQQLNNQEPDAAIALVGTKCDLAKSAKHAKDCVPLAEVEGYAQRLGALAFQTSSVTGERVDALFQHVAETCAKNKAAVPAAYAPSLRVGDSMAISGASGSSKCC